MRAPLLGENISWRAVARICGLISPLGGGGTRRELREGGAVSETNYQDEYPQQRNTWFPLVGLTGQRVGSAFSMAERSPGHQKLSASQKYAKRGQTRIEELPKILREVSL